MFIPAHKESQKKKTKSPFLQKARNSVLNIKRWTNFIKELALRRQLANNAKYLQ